MHEQALQRQKMLDEASGASQSFSEETEEEFREEDQVINLNDKSDLNLLKNLANVVKAYQQLSDRDHKYSYLKTIRLRSWASQYMNTNAAENDGYIYPFLLFSVQENKQTSSDDVGGGRMIELNFVEDVLNDRMKDHNCNSYHISMVEKVIKGFKYDEFIIEFQNDTKPISYFATFPLQRDYIVEMINFALIKYKKSMESNKGINCPDNHNLKKKTQGPDIDKLVEPNLQLEFILDDFVLPPKALYIGECLKKNNTLGWEKRFLMLGHSQLLIARDPNFEKVVGVIPLEGGFCMVKKPRNFGGLIIESTFRQYCLKFPDSTMMVNWYKRVQMVASKQVKLKKYQKRVQIQTDRLQQENIQFMYKNLLNNIDDKLKQLKQLLKKKFEIEYKYREQIDMNEKEIAEKIKSVNFKAQTIMTQNFSFNMLRDPGFSKEQTLV